MNEAENPAPRPLEGKVALVTGGSRGLGREMVLAFAGAGASVVIASRKVDACEALAEEVIARFGSSALAVGANVSHWDDCDALVKAAYDRFDHVDVLVNNAGMSPLYPSLDQVNEALYDKVLGVNLKGPFRLTALVGTRMAAGGGGSIINISSTEATRPEATALPYAAAKAGLEALTLGFMRAFGPTVRVNTIRCGMFRTDISKAWGDPAVVDELARQRVALGRVGEPPDIVGAALFLATDASAYCTGATITLDGGVR
jgi:NAD(P)-dependent dehydrogenase (short-subunit alcohol dehydrogenase family)